MLKSLILANWPRMVFSLLGQYFSLQKAICYSYAVLRRVCRSSRRYKFGTATQLPTLAAIIVSKLAQCCSGVTRPSHCRRQAKNKLASQILPCAAGFAYDVPPRLTFQCCCKTSVLAYVTCYAAFMLSPRLCFEA